MIAAMKTKLALIPVLLILTTIAVYAFGKQCPLCNSGMIWTGKTQYEWGKAIKQYRCPAGHTFWMVN
jgi:hypothetical protein